MFADYNIHLVNLSIFIAVVASYSALSITARISTASRKSKLFWLVAGAIVMGAGVWSMHFVGMIAHYSHATVQYNIPITIVSMVASVIASYVAFYLIMSNKIKSHHITIGGLSMGSGIAAMHYIGMEAINMDGEMTYHLPLVIILYFASEK